jgi:hypothetical protein
MKADLALDSAANFFNFSPVAAESVTIATFFSLKIRGEQVEH